MPYNDRILVPTPLNFHAHKVPQIGGGLLRLPQRGEGLGSLFKTFFKWLIPAGKAAAKSVFKSGLETTKDIAKSKIVRDAAKTLKDEAVNAGINVAQTALSGGNIKDEFKKQTRNIRSTVSDNIKNSLDQYRPEEKKKIKRKIPNRKKIVSTKKPKVANRFNDNLS